MLLEAARRSEKNVLTLGDDQRQESGRGLSGVLADWCLRDFLERRRLALSPPSQSRRGTCSTHE